MSQREKAVVIMAAGQGTRMKSSVSKLLHCVAGKPLIFYPLSLAVELEASRIILVLGHQREEIETYVARAFPTAPVESVVQTEQLGTAHAVLCAQNALHGFEGDVIILSGDVPCLRAEVLQELNQLSARKRVGLVTMQLSVANRYGRLIRNPDGEAQAITEFGDCTPQEQAIEELNSGIYQVDADFLFDRLQRIGTNNAQGEFYLTDLIAIAAQEGTPAAVLKLDHQRSLWAVGVNNRVDLANAEAQVQKRLAHQLMIEGVTLTAPHRVYLETDVTVGTDTTIEPDVSLRGHSTIGVGCTIGQGSIIVDCTLEDGVHVKPYSHLEKAHISAACTVGPFARLREGTHLESEVKIGNFVETKKAHFAHGAKASHLSYLGDAEIGSKANIGAGTITCNYDGYKKSKTVIGSGAFIGSDTQLVAPVQVGAGAIVGAGTTVTKDVPGDALVLSRTSQVHVDGWAKRKRERELARKKDS
ncbi:MAG: bifunctional UDP-N-acetylglucosamine diphosphorylase/glucosamine-1-phosphate N-acetyltransferase GlmU [Bradymonadia bacterium]